MTDPERSDASPGPSGASLGEILATIEAGDVVLLGGALPMWTGCLMRIEQVRSWGVIGTVRGPKAADYPLRVSLENITTVFRERR